MKHKDTKTQRSESREGRDDDRLSHAIIGAAIEVHRNLGPGFLESIYEEALAVELGLRGLGFDRQQRVPIMYKDRVIGEHVIDFVVAGEIVVELKATEQLIAVHYAQLHSCLKAAELELGLLINFNVPTLKSGVRRVVLRGTDPLDLASL
jgi:GxxExxY protein